MYEKDNTGETTLPALYARGGALFPYIMSEIIPVEPDPDNAGVVETDAHLLFE